MDNKEIRLRIVEVMVPKASQVGITNPSEIIKKCAELEDYVLSSAKVSEDSLTSQPRKQSRTPRKGKASPDTSEQPAPAHVG